MAAFRAVVLDDVGPFGQGGGRQARAEPREADQRMPPDQRVRTRVVHGLWVAGTTNDRLIHTSRDKMTARIFFDKPGDLDKHSERMARLRQEITHASTDTGSATRRDARSAQSPKTTRHRRDEQGTSGTPPRARLRVRRPPCGPPKRPRPGTCGNRKHDGRRIHGRIDARGGHLRRGALQPKCEVARRSRRRWYGTIAAFRVLPLGEEFGAKIAVELAAVRPLRLTARRPASWDEIRCRWIGSAGIL